MMTDSLTLGCALTPDDIAREVRHLPSAPKVLPRLKVLLADVNSSIADIVALIRLDPGIAARVLQTGNSSYFGAGARCTTVAEAVNRVGFDQIYDLVSYAVASQVLVRPLEIYGVEADDLWKMSVACALGAEVLAERTGQDRDTAYTVGLLHAIGMVAIDEWSLRAEQKFCFRSAGFPREAVESERAALGFTNADAGAALLHHWEFGANLVDPVRWQYAPRASASHAPMASLLHAAKWLRSAVCSPLGSLRPALPEASHLAPIGLNPAALPGLAEEVARRLTTATSLLELGQDRARAARHRFPSAPVGVIFR